MGAVCGCCRATAISSLWPPRREPDFAETNYGGSEEPVSEEGEVHEFGDRPGACGLRETLAINKRVQDSRRARVEWLKKLQKESASQQEFDTARSHSVWTQLDSSACSSSSCPLDLPPSKALERIRQENRLHFQHLLDTERHSTIAPGAHPPRALRHLKEDLLFKELGLSWFYVDFGDSLKAGQKFGGGAQADIHEVIYNGEVLEWCVLKVFRIEVLLTDLQRSWTKQLINHRMKQHGQIRAFWNCCGIKHGTLLQDGRFAFVFQRCWGDLRKAIDLEIVKDGTYVKPPFPHAMAVSILFSIASGMNELARFGIIHKDLKGANCLLLHNPRDIPPNIDSCLVADFESSEGVEGTRFWRAPEVLLALKNRKNGIHSTKEVWTTEADVYSFAMTCYEVLTGCIPFEETAPNDYDGVIGGERPPLPSYVDPKLQELVRRCWHSEPSMRPDFFKIVRELEFMYLKLLKGTKLTL